MDSDQAEHLASPQTPAGEASKPTDESTYVPGTIRVSARSQLVIKSIAGGRSAREVIEMSLMAYANPANMVNRGLSELRVAVKALEMVNYKQCLLLGEVLKACTRVDEVSHLHHARVAALLAAQIKRLKNG
jgi:hypothetical protein